MQIIKQLMAIFTLLVLIPSGIFAQTHEDHVKTNVIKNTHSIHRVEAKTVCMGMGTNRVFERELIPAVVDGKTYYGCCEGCQNTLLKDPNSRVSVDPFTGNKVDKAIAVIGAMPSGVVHYFETEETMKQFVQLLHSME